MKRNLFLLLLAAILFCCDALAESADPGILEALREAGFSSAPAHLQARGNTAACVADKDGLSHLCVLEKENGLWRITVSNAKALLPGRDAAWLLLDSDQALFWTYQDDDMGFQFSSYRDETGAWGPVSEIITENTGEGRLYVYPIAWREDRGGEIVWRRRTEDENENLKYESGEEYVPAFWLKDAVTLDAFDASRFPAMGSCRDDYFPWPGEAFLKEAAENLLPGCAYLGGAMWQNEMHFLVQKPNGDKVYVVCDTHFNPQEFSLIESAPLPPDAVLGVENFTGSIGYGDRIVSIQNIPNYPWCGLSMAWGHRDFVYFGPNCVLENLNDLDIWVGSHPWSNIQNMDWSAVPVTLEDADKHLDAANWAVVSNPNPADRLHLREKPDKGSASLGKYYNGTPVRVWEIRGDWAQVEIGNHWGWMMKQYLTLGADGQALYCDTRAMPKLQMRGEALKLFVEPDGTMYETKNAVSLMKVIGVIGSDWYHVWFPLTGEYAFVRQSDLWEGNG